MSDELKYFQLLSWNKTVCYLSVPEATALDVNEILKQIYQPRNRIARPPALHPVPRELFEAARDVGFPVIGTDPGGAGRDTQTLR